MSRKADICFHISFFGSENKIDNSLIKKLCYDVLLSAGELDPDDYFDENPENEEKTWISNYVDDHYS